MSDFEKCIEIVCSQVERKREEMEDKISLSPHIEQFLRWIEDSAEV